MDHKILLEITALTAQLNAARHAAILLTGHFPGLETNIAYASLKQVLEHAIERANNMMKLEMGQKVDLGTAVEPETSIDLTSLDEILKETFDEKLMIEAVKMREAEIRAERAEATVALPKADPIRGIARKFGSKK
jgi:hypothetical protein